MIKMGFDLQRFYQELDEYYAAHNNENTEKFLLKSRQQVCDSGQIYPINMGCPSCIPKLEPNYEYISVCNEIACFYRGISKFEESLENFLLAQRELESLYQKDTLEYATILLNKAGTYRYMGKLEAALENFRLSEEILERIKEVQPQVLAGLYNNMGLVYLDMSVPQKAEFYFQKALPLVDKNQERIVEQGTTRNNLAVAFQALGKMEDAVNAMNEAVEILSKLDHGENPHYPAALNTRGTFLYHVGKIEEALKDFEGALTKTRLIYGENIEYAFGCDNCAAALRKIGKNKAAEQYEKLAYDIRRRLGMVK